MVRANETRLFYVDTGNMPGGRTVVALHSLGADHRLWSDQIEFLAPYARVIAPKSRGHGRSEWDRDVTLEDWFVDTRQSSSTKRESTQPT
jgi:pimeloyl-ACP methyl ester carboxylesterase